MNQATNQPVVSPPVIRLTPVEGVDGEIAGQMIVPTLELIAYSQDLGRTRLHLTGRRTLEVKETTQDIDLLVRTAAR
jgi:hypothetical protein